MDSRIATHKHIHSVQMLMTCALNDLSHRLIAHDQSKLQSPEKEILDANCHKLADPATRHGTAGYAANLSNADMTTYREHHYAHNDHHPEHYGERGVRGMNLCALLEMLCDWVASAIRDGNKPLDSIAYCQNRFGFSDELKDILINTLPLFEAKLSAVHPG